MAIFVVGIERSGTKWLSNILSNHPSIISVQSDEHRGIIESNMLRNMETKFDLNSDDDYIGMLQLWFSTDFFKATQIDPLVFYSLDPRPTNCIELFKILMDKLANQQDKPFWLQKANPEEALKVLNTIPKARVVVIKRDLIDNLKSIVQDFRNRGKRLGLAHATYTHILHEKQLKRVQKQQDAIQVTYEGLLHNGAREIERICKHIGLEYIPSKFDVGYSMNSSFTDSSERRRVLNPFDENLVRLLATIFRLIPLPIFHFFTRLKQLFYPGHAASLIPGTFNSQRQSVELVTTPASCENSGESSRN